MDMSCVPEARLSRAQGRLLYLDNRVDVLYDPMVVNISLLFSN